jgi:hypothetical protein
MDRQAMIDAICAEVDRAKALYPRFNSNHEGYAVLLEEVDELWDLVKRDKGIRCTEAMRRELIQIAAMAVRFMEDLNGD